MRLTVGWSSHHVCHHCFATTSSYACVPSPMLPRRDAANFASEACRSGDCIMANLSSIVWGGPSLMGTSCSTILIFQGPLLRMRNFDHNQIRWCAMHTLNLGMVAFMAGSTLRILTNEHHWEGGSEEQQLKVAFREFSAWAKQQKIPLLAQTGYIYISI